MDHDAQGHSEHGGRGKGHDEFTGIIITIIIIIIIIIINSMEMSSY
jgi:hypothetical protein